VLKRVRQRRRTAGEDSDSGDGAVEKNLVGAMPVSKPPLAAALRVGGQVVLGFYIHAYNGLTFGAAELIYGPPSACVHLGVRLPLLDLVHAVCKTVFGDAPPALTALDVGLVMALDSDKLTTASTPTGARPSPRLGTATSSSPLPSRPSSAPSR